MLSKSTSSGLFVRNGLHHYPRHPARQSCCPFKRHVKHHVKALPPAIECLGFLPMTSPWGPWAALITCGAVGQWAERNTKLGKELSAALCSTLCGMFFANIGILPANAKEVHLVFKFILPLAIPLLLFQANLLRIFTQTGRMLPAFLLGSVCVLVGSAVAFLLIPLGSTSYLGQEGWKIAAALTARHIGGAVNYIGLCDSLSVSKSTFGAGLAADDLILALYFSVLFALARNTPPDSQESTANEPASRSGDPKPIFVTEGLVSLALSSLICFISYLIQASSGLQGQLVTIITACSVILATIFSKQLSPLFSSASGMAQILMMIFYASIGASANISLVIQTAPILFLFSFVAIGLHLGLLILLGKLLGFTQKDLLLASNANIGGPSTVGSMASSKGWESMVVPSMLCSSLGYAIGTPLGLWLGNLLRATLP
jgi:uncharacterized membrane protein